MLGCRINVKTGEVKRTVLYDAQNMDHPRVNPHFYSRKTRYVYFNASEVPSSPGEAGPPQVCDWNQTDVPLLFQASVVPCLDDA